MKQSTREKIALVVFVLLIVVAAVLLIGYFTTGRTWSVAATFVDDMAGSMDGYTMLVYSGTVEPDSKSAEEPALSSDEDAGEGGAAGTTEGAGDKNAGTTEGAADVDADADAIDTDTGAGADADTTSSESGIADSIGLSILSLLPRNTSSDETVYISDVRDVYERKGAEVVSVDASDLNRYLEPQILYAGDKRIGIYSLDYYATRARLADYRDYFDEQDVDVVVCITQRANMMATYDGCDVVIVTTDDKGFSTAGTTIGGTFIVRSPESGQAGAVILSSNNVPSSKVISRL